MCFQNQKCPEANVLVALLHRANSLTHSALLAASGQDMLQSVSFLFVVTCTAWAATAADSQVSVTAMDGRVYFASIEAISGLPCRGVVVNKSCELTFWLKF